MPRPTKTSAEALVRTDAAQMAQLLDSLPQFIGLLDPDGTIRYLNRAPVEAAGIPEKNLLGIKFWDSFWWRGGDHERLRREIARAAKGETIRREAQVLTKDGPIHIDFILSPIFDKERKVIQVIAEGRNITELKMAIKTVGDRERLLRQVIDLVPHFIFAKNREGRFILVNKAVADAYGTTVEELTGKTDADFAKSEEEIRHFREDDLAVIDGGKPKWIPEESITYPDGVAHFLSTVKIPFDFSGTPAVLGVSVDITEKKRLWEEAQKVQRIEALGILAGGIAHDFNNLLSALFGFMDLARISTKEPQTKHFLEEALRGLNRARGLTRQLLTFAKGGAPVRHTAQIQPLIRETVSFTLSGSSVRTVFDLPDDLPPCLHDPDQMAQVITNITLNANQAMPGGGEFTVSATEVSLRDQEVPSLGAGRYLRISFQDTGIGIPASILPHIFDPFFTTKQKGSGLGLAISYSIIQRHGGTMTVASEPGKGTVFALYVPVAAVEQIRESKFPPSFRHHGTGRILVMDDDPALRALLCSFLEQAGYQTTGVADGAAAAEVFLSAQQVGNPFAAVFLDLIVPGGVGGLEAASRMRVLDPTVLLFVVSGYSADPVMAEPHRYGFTDHLSKPFTMEDLVQLLERHLKRV